MSKRPAEEDFDPVVVDALNLDREWQAQPRFMKKACEASALAKTAVNLCRSEIKVYEAEMGLQIRKHYDQYGFDKKPSDKVCENAVIAQPGWVKLQRKLAALQEEHDLCEALVTALSHKKAALENSVILYCRDYNSEPRLPREHNEAAKERLHEVTTSKRYSGHKGTSGGAYDGPE